MSATTSCAGCGVAETQSRFGVGLFGAGPYGAFSTWVCFAPGAASGNWIATDLTPPTAWAPWSPSNPGNWTIVDRAA